MGSNLGLAPQEIFAEQNKENQKGQKVHSQSQSNDWSTVHGMSIYIRSYIFRLSQWGGGGILFLQIISTCLRGA
jgi:hypothetical protein